MSDKKFRQLHGEGISLWIARLSHLNSKVGLHKSVCGRQKITKAGPLLRTVYEGRSATFWSRVLRLKAFPFPREILRIQ